MRKADDLPLLIVLNVKKIRSLNLPGTPWATSASCGRPLPFNFVELCVYTRIYTQKSIIKTWKEAETVGEMGESGLEGAVMTVGDAGEKQFWAKDALYRYYSNRGFHISYSSATLSTKNF